MPVSNFLGRSLKYLSYCCTEKLGKQWILLLDMNALNVLDHVITTGNLSIKRKDPRESVATFLNNYTFLVVEQPVPCC